MFINKANILFIRFVYQRYEMNSKLTAHAFMLMSSVATC